MWKQDGWQLRIRGEKRGLSRAGYFFLWLNNLQIVQNWFASLSLSLAAAATLMPRIQQQRQEKCSMNFFVPALGLVVSFFIFFCHIRECVFFVRFPGKHQTDEPWSHSKPETWWNCIFFLITIAILAIYQFCCLFILFLLIIKHMALGVDKRSQQRPPNLWEDLCSPLVLHLIATKYYWKQWKLIRQRYGFSCNRSVGNRLHSSVWFLIHLPLVFFLIFYLFLFANRALGTKKKKTQIAQLQKPKPHMVVVSHVAEEFLNFWSLKCKSCRVAETKTGKGTREATILYTFSKELPRVWRLSSLGTSVLAPSALGGSIKLHN